MLSSIKLLLVIFKGLPSYRFRTNNAGLAIKLKVNTTDINFTLWYLIYFYNLHKVSIEGKLSIEPETYA